MESGIPTNVEMQKSPTRPVPTVTDYTSQQTLVDGLLDDMDSCVGERDVSSLQEILTAAQSPKTRQHLVVSSRFREYLEKVTADVAGGSDEQAVLTLAELGRLYRSIRSERQWVSTLIARILSTSVPESFQFGDHDQRRYSAIASVASSIEIESDVIARALAEENAPKVRDIWCDALLDRDLTLSKTFGLLTTAIAEINQGQEPNSGDTHSRRLHHILATLNRRLMRIEVNVEETIVISLQHFISEAFSKVPRPEEYRNSAMAVEQLLDTVLLIIRLKFRLGARPDLYNATAHAERWLPPQGWIRFTRASARMKQLRQTLLEGLVLLLEQGKPDRDLIKAHRALTPNQRFAQRELNGLERRSLHLSPDSRKWLASGGTMALQAETVEFNDTDDLSIAMALIVADSLRHRSGTDIDTLLADLRFRIPVHAETIEHMVNLTRQLTDRVASLAARRKLQLFASAGDVVDFSPHAYRLPENTPLTRRVRVRSPGVEKIGRSSSRVVVPALVEAIS